MQIKRVKYLTVILLSTAALAVQATPISVSQSLDRSEMAYEDSAHLEIQITWDGPVSAYLFDKPLRLNSDKLKVAGFSSKISSAGSGDSEVTTKLFRYNLVPTASGMATIDPATIEYLKWPDSVSGQLVTDALSLTIAEPIPVVVQKTGRGLLWIFIPVAAVLAVGAAGLLIFVKKRRPKETQQPPKVVFLERMDSLSKQAGNDLKQFQTGFYRNLLTYLKDTANLQDGDSSLNSVIESLEASKLPRMQVDKFTAWLTRAEREKFSPIQAPPGETIRLASEIRQFFENID